jgi:hypothetical protein
MRRILPVVAERRVRNILCRRPVQVNRGPERRLPGKPEVQKKAGMPSC